MQSLQYSSSPSCLYDQPWSDANTTTSPVYGEPWGYSPSNWHRTHGPSLEDLHRRLLSLETTLMMWDLNFGLPCSSSWPEASDAQDEQIASDNRSCSKAGSGDKTTQILSRRKRGRGWQYEIVMGNKDPIWSKSVRIELMSQKWKYLSGEPSFTGFCYWGIIYRGVKVDDDDQNGGKSARDLLWQTRNVIGVPNTLRNELESIRIPIKSTASFGVDIKASCESTRSSVSRQHYV
ncbi:hypothetical protein R3P38DRAFT_2771021 [Favolaschia claudopus]|uniref:Uncharacterized protein n=1 Tax=Favolaschia claudopus TaxID=2862362 RepID=A0AAW0CDB3_9AGAR